MTKDNNSSTTFTKQTNGAYEDVEQLEEIVQKVIDGALKFDANILFFELLFVDLLSLSVDLLF